MLKSQDIVVLLKLALMGDQKWKYSDIAESLYMSASEVHAAVKRCDYSNLYSLELKRVNDRALMEFLTYGVRYAFPVRPGAIARGIPTSHSAEPLNCLIQSGDIYVWPDSNGVIRGQAIVPLYKSVPDACRGDIKLYEVLSLVDALRAGRSRERNLAVQLLEEKICA